LKAQEKTKKIESKFNQFFGQLKEACQKRGIYVFVTGVIPLAFTDFNDALGISRDSEFAEMYGFTEEEVKSQLNFMPRELDLVDDVLKVLRDTHNGYRFSKLVVLFSQQETQICVPSMYNPERIRHNLWQISKKYHLLEKEDALNGSRDLILKDLFNFEEDPNTKPAESTLQLLAKNPLLGKVTNELLEAKNRMQSCSTFRLVVTC
jgi:hypothetical protein